MNMTDSMLSQFLTVGAPTQTQPSKPADHTGAKHEDFNTLIQRKQQEAKSAAGQQPERKEPVDTASTPEEGDVTQVPEEQRVLAAALAAQSVVIMPFQDPAAPAEDAIPQAPVAAVPEVQAVKPVEDAPQQAEAGPQEQNQPREVIVRDSVEAPKTAETPVAAVPEQKAETAGGVQQAQSEQSAQVHETRPEKGTAWSKETQLVRERDGMKVEADSQIEPQPLFREAEAPVKVGAPEAPVRTEDGDLERQMAGRVKEALAQGAERVEVKLTPRSMGDVTVELTRTPDGALHVALHATTERGANLLSEHANSLSALLQSGTQAPVSVEVQRPQELQQPQQSQQQPGDQGWDGDGRQGNPQQESRQQRQQESQDFLQQLRLGLVAPEGTAS